MDDITAQFAHYAGRAPRDGDTFAEEPTHTFDAEHGHLIAVQPCWRYRDGRWDSFTSVARGAPGTR